MPVHRQADPTAQVRDKPTFNRSQSILGELAMYSARAIRT